jgi:hypothetical protein
MGKLEKLGQKMFYLFLLKNLPMLMKLLSNSTSSFEGISSFSLLHC